MSPPEQGRKRPSDSTCGASSRHPESRVALALGGNHPDSLTALRLAYRALGRVVSEARVSPVFRSPPLGGPVQPEFLNAAVIGRSALPAADLLAVAKEIEHSLGRRRSRRWGPRRIDIDLLLHGELISDRPELTLPHPGLLSRDFVLQPLARIASDWSIPGSGLTVAEALARLSSAGAVELDQRLD